MKLDPRIAQITGRIGRRSAATRAAYLEKIAHARRKGPARGSLSCGNLAHGFAASDAPDKLAIKAVATPNLGIVTAFNDMLSAHQPFETYPAIIKDAARRAGGTAQVAGGVPAMCDGVTQGRPGMELSLFSRDVIAMATAIALCHDMFDAALCLGVCDKIVPGLLIGALAFGHLPVIFVPAGPMTSGLDNKSKAAVRERYAAGQATRDELLEAEAASYHGAGTCTFYGTANSNQMLIEAMGLQLPGRGLRQPRHAAARGTDARRHAAGSVLHRAGPRLPPDRPAGRRDAPSSTALATLHGHRRLDQSHDPLVAMARAAGIIINWDDFDAIAQAVPLLTRIYPNGTADVNHFQAAGGMGFVMRELLDAGLMHADAVTTSPGAGGMRAYTQEPRAARGRAGTGAMDRRQRRRPGRTDRARGRSRREGGLRLLTGNLGRARDQDFRRRARTPAHRGAGHGVRRPGRPRRPLQGGQADRRLRGRRALPGAARQRHAGDCTAWRPCWVICKAVGARSPW